MYEAEKLCGFITALINIPLLCGMVSLLIFTSIPPHAPSSKPDYIHPSCEIYCSGSILHIIQTGGLLNDSKEFVDMPLKTSPETAIGEFSRLPNYNTETLQAFVDNYFSPAASDLKIVKPVDHQAEPPTLKNALKGHKYYEWALALNKIWQDLVRQPEIPDPARHTLLPSEYPIVVPGGRFRESYYWDSYWIVVGLLQCDMHVTAKGVVANFLKSVREFGFVPNGGRSYLLARSQPPMLAEMVWELYKANASSLVETEALPILELEYSFWQNQRSVDVEGVILNRYTGGDQPFPRPDSYHEEMETSAMSENQNKAQLDLSAGAETGWDYSSRWTGRKEGRLDEIDTRNIVPVDLNIILLRYEKHLATLFGEFGNCDKVTLYERYAESREKAIQKLLWSENEGMWRDWMIAERNTSEVVAISNFIPLWAGLGRDRKPQVLEALKATGLVRAGGVATSTVETGQQWDGDNAWPPLQDLIVEGLLNGGDDEGRRMAIDIVKKWLDSNFQAWQEHGVMREKYLASKPGEPGGGGGYEVQGGFGWTNGVALKMLVKFADEL